MNDLKKFSQNIKFTKYLFYMDIDFLKERLQCDRLLKQSSFVVYYNNRFRYSNILQYNIILEKYQYTRKVFTKGFVFIHK